MISLPPQFDIKQPPQGLSRPTLLVNCDSVPKKTRISILEQKDNVSSSVADPHLLLCGSGIQKMSIPMDPDPDPRG